MIANLQFDFIWPRRKTWVKLKQKHNVTYHMHQISIWIYWFQHAILERFVGFLEEKNDEPTPTELKPVLKKLCALYGLWSLDKHMATLYQGCHIVSFFVIDFTNVFVLTCMFDKSGCNQQKKKLLALLFFFNLSITAVRLSSMLLESQVKKSCAA